MIKNTIRNTPNLSKSSWLGLLFTSIFAASLMIVLGGMQSPSHAQASCSPASDFGLVTMTTDVPSGDGYRVWSRVKAPDGNPSYVFHISGAGGSLCDQTISGSGSANQWTWVEGPAMFNWSGGQATVHLSGNKAGVGLDCVVLTTDSDFSPSTADDCASSSSDTTAPTVIITNQDNATANTDTYTVAVDATDSSGIDRVEVSINNVLTHTDNTAPYTYDWDITAITNDDYAINVTAYDTASNQQSSSATIRVRHPDINRDNSIGIFDLSRMLTLWGQSAVAEDLNGNGTVDVFDLSIMLGRWDR